MCSFARLACYRRHPASFTPLRSLRFSIFRWRFFSNLVPPAGARAAGGSRGRARLSTPRPPHDRMPARWRSRVHILSHVFTNPSVEIIAMLDLERPCRAQSARLPLEASPPVRRVRSHASILFTVPQHGISVHADIQFDLHDAAYRPLVGLPAVPRSNAARFPAKLLGCH